MKNAMIPMLQVTWHFCIPLTSFAPMSIFQGCKFCISVQAVLRYVYALAWILTDWRNLRSAQKVTPSVDCKVTRRKHCQRMVVSIQYVNFYNGVLHVCQLLWFDKTIFFIHIFRSMDLPSIWFDGKSMLLKVWTRRLFYQIKVQQGICGTRR